MAKFKAIYSPNFDQIARVEAIIQKWEKGERSFDILSSGSTGNPKIITISKDLLVWSANATLKHLDLKPKSILCCLPVDKTAGFMQLIRALCWGCEIHFHPPSQTPLSTPVKNSFSIISLTPNQVEYCIENQRDNVHKFKHVLIGGAALTQPLSYYASLDLPHTNLWFTYGMTETASHIAIQNLSKSEPQLKLLTGVLVETNADHTEIQIPELSLSIQVNDILKVHPTGISILGRRDHVINSDGIKIHPDQIEPLIQDAFDHLNINRRFYVTKQSSDRYGEIAILVMEETTPVDEQKVLTALSNLLPKYHTPKKIRYSKAFEYTDTGKLIRRTY